MAHTPTSYDACLAYLNRISAGFDGYMPFDEATRAAQEKEQIYATYGELLPQSSANLLSACNFTPHDTFYDLGSGTGRLCAQAFLTTAVQHSVGIEVVHERHMHAEAMGERMAADYPQAFEGGRTLRFIEANLLHTDFSDATVLYTCSTAFSKELVAQIATLAEGCKQLRYFLSLRPTPFHLPLLHDVVAPCSWGKFTHCYVYGPK